MNSENFIKALKRHVGDAAVEDTIAKLRQPPGRRVPPAVQASSDWYNALSVEDVKSVNSIISIAVHEAMFGVLAVLDGARIIDDEGGRFELTYLADQRVVLNDPHRIGLHDLLNASS